MNKIYFIFALLISFTLFSCDEDGEKYTIIDGPRIFDYNPLRIVFLDANGNNLLGGVSITGNTDVVPFPVEYDGKYWEPQGDYIIDMPGTLSDFQLHYSVSEKALYYDFPDVADCGGKNYGNHYGRIDLRCPTIWADNEYHTIVVENKITERVSSYDWSTITIDGTDISNQFVEGSTTVRKYVVK